MQYFYLWREDHSDISGYIDRSIVEECDVKSCSILGEWWRTMTDPNRFGSTMGSETGTFEG